MIDMFEEDPTIPARLEAGPGYGVCSNTLHLHRCRSALSAAAPSNLLTIYAPGTNTHKSDQCEIMQEHLRVV